MAFSKDQCIPRSVLQLGTTSSKKFGTGVMGTARPDFTGHRPDFLRENSSTFLCAVSSLHIPGTMDTRGGCTFHFASASGIPSGSRGCAPRRPRRPSLFHLSEACHAAQAQLREGLCSGLPRFLAPLSGGSAQGGWGSPAAEPGDCDGWAQAQRAALAFLASLCLSLGGCSSPAQALNLPSAAEDKLLEVVRLLENKIDTAAQFAGEALCLLQGDASPGEQGGASKGSERWKALVQDVWEVVDANYMDARGAGFSREAWKQALDDALSRPLNSQAAAYGAIRDMVRGLRDPYSRFISPEEFSAMLKYDVSGVGLNLGTAEEFVNKTGIPLPGYGAPGSSSGGSSQAGPASLASESSGMAAALPPSSSSSSSSGGGGGGGASAAAAGPGAAAAATRGGGSSSNGNPAADSGGIYILGLISGTAADAAGLEQGDQLLAVGGQSLVGRTPFEVASMLSGSQDDNEELANSLGLAKKAVQVQVRKFDSQQVVDVSLERPVRVVPSPVTARLERPPSLPFPLPALAPPGSLSSATTGGGGSGSGELVGYIKLSSFNARAQRDLAAAVRRLEGEGATRLVLDLRDNRGGLVSEGIEAARLFLEGNALVVQPTGRARASAADITAPGPALTPAPLVVLVNEHTASASEILAGALQDNCRAVLVGRQTFGKGLIQSVYELNDGSGLVLTVGKYMTPRGTDIDREGIRPQFRSMPSVAAAEETLQACRLSTPR